MDIDFNQNNFLSLEDRKQVEDVLLKEQIAMAEFDLCMRKLVRKFQVPEAVAIRRDILKFIDQAGQIIQGNDKELTIEEYENFLKLKMEAEEIAAETKLFLSKLRQKYNVSVFAVLNEKYEWVIPSSRPSSQLSR